MSKKIAGTLLLVMIVVSTPVMAQEACNIDIGETMNALLEAQVASAQGDVSGTQSALTDVQTALDALVTECSAEATGPLPLTQTFVSPDEVFSFNYPDDWVAGDYEPLETVFSSEFGGLVTIGRDMETVEDFFGSGSEAIQVMVGSVSAVVRQLGLFDPDAPVDEVVDLDELMQRIRTSSEENSIEISNFEEQVLNDLKAVSFTFSQEDIEAAIIIVELTPTETYGVIVTGSPDGNLAAILPTLDAVAASIQLQP